ncbi:MAG: ABC transporter ATP-binding protein [Bacteroidota bacterium]
MSSPLLSVQSLSLHFKNDSSTVNAIDNSSFDLQKGETIGIVGESGSGKSVTALSILQLLPKAAKMSNGHILFDNEQATPTDLTQLSLNQIQQLRGRQIAMIFQEPMTALNPVISCGQQVVEAIQLHQKKSVAEAKKETLQLFEKVQLPDVERIFDAFPHQLSGGQKQRIMIAMALSCRPKLLIADEPTTALDVTVQKEILQLLQQLKEEYQLSILFISHDLGVIRAIADRVLIMKKGVIVERGQTADIFNRPQHLYTKGLLNCRPQLNQHLSRLPTVEDFEKGNVLKSTISKENPDSRKEKLYQQAPLLSVQQLATWYPVKRNFWGQPTQYVKAVNNVSFDVFKGETLGLVGESGCGKSTLGRTLLGLEKAQSGEIFYKKENILIASSERWKTLRRKMQIIFQDPYSSLNPTQPIGLAIMEPMKVHRLWKNEQQYRQKATELLETVGLEAAHFMRFPHEFSGGQRQRICIARALAVQPEFIICDECVSALDVSIQAQILNLLLDLREQFDLTYIFISHDLSVVQFISDRIMVMQSGKIVEIGDADSIYHQPKSPYTQSLINAIL